jgi:small subunit ribosomal protein S4
MFDTRERKERALGTRLFLKAFRSASPKSAMVRRPARPGEHGKDRRRAPSEYGKQLSEKQKFKAAYGLREAQMRKVFKTASKSVSTTGPMIMSLLERRLDNVVYRLGLAPSRSVGRQLIGHGHMTVNGRRVTIPSIQVRPKDVIAIRIQSKDHPAFRTLGETLKKHQAPTWLSVDPDKWEGKVTSMPKDLEIPFDIALVVDYYSKIVK